MKNLLSLQQDFFQTEKTLDYSYRLRALKKLYKGIKQAESALMKALKKDLGKGSFESYASEIGFTLAEISHAQKKLKKWMKPKCSFSSLVNLPGYTKVFSEPYGNALIISPWNYPFNLCIAPLVGAIAAGNTCIIKTSEFAPHTSSIIRKIIEDIFNENYIAVVEGGVATTQELLALPFQKIFFTGSTQVGKVVMKAGAEHLASVTLELGGKSPCIVDRTADLEVAAKRITWGKFLNAGQTCVAPDYIYVHQDIKEAFINLVKKEIQSFYGEQIKKNFDYGRIVNKKHFERLTNLIDTDKVKFGGEVDLSERYIAPTILEPVYWTDAIMKEEIFGPLMPIMDFTDIDQVINKIKEEPKPLALYLFSKNKHTAKKVFKSCSFGGGCLNDTIVHLAEANLPFGGVGNSGVGNYHGKYSFDCFSHKKAVLFKPFWLDIPLRYPPYKNKLNIIKRIIK